MKVEKSQYLQNCKPVLLKLRDRLLQDYPYASILAVDTHSVVYMCNKRNTVISENGLLSNRGFVVKVYDGNAYGEYSFNYITEDGIEQIVAEIKEKVMELKNTVGKLSLSDYKMLSDEPCELDESTEYEISPDELGDEEILKRLREIKDTGLKYDEKVLDCSVSVNYQAYSKLFISKNRTLEQNVMWTNGHVSVNVKRGQEVKMSYSGFSNLGGFELLSSMKEGVGKVAEQAIALLDAEPMVPGEYECVCTPTVTGMIVHEAFGHGVEMDMFVKDRALAKSFVGEYVASEMVTMHDGASMAGRIETASYFFDDEGVLATDTIVIDKGVLQTGISDAQAALALGSTPTGNGRRESYKRKAYSRMTNTYFEAGKDKLEDMIASIQYGFLLDDAMSGMEDPKNWGIQLMVNVAKEIKDGKLTGKVFSPCVMSGYVPDLLKSISMMSEEVELCGSGFCGKGYKEWVKVSDGGPYMKAKIRLG